MSKRLDLTGQRFGRWSVIDSVRVNGIFKWNCLCDCGNIRTVLGNSLKCGESKSCGCLKKEIVVSRNGLNRSNLTGQKFGRLTVIGDRVRPAVGLSKAFTMWECLCDCGAAAVVRASHLKNGATKSCGCYARERTSIRMKILPHQNAFNRARYHAAKRGISFDLSLEFYQSLEGNPCHYCDIALGWERHASTEGGRGHNLDRKDNDIGYTESNVVPCCAICNWVKSDHIGYEEMLLIGQARKSYREQLR